MVQNAAEGKKVVRSVNVGQVCSNTELRIFSNSNKLVCLTSQIAFALQIHVPMITGNHVVKPFLRKKN